MTNLKQEYLNNKYGGEEIRGSQYNEKMRLERASQYEKEIGKDLCDFTRDEAIRLFKDVVATPSLTYLKVLRSTYESYTQWCVEKGVATENNYSHIDLSDLNECVFKGNLSFITREDILKWCSEAENPRDQFILLALYEGIRGKNYKEIIDLNITNVDFEHKRIFIPSRNGCVEASDELLRYAKYSYETDDYVREDGIVKKISPLPRGSVVRRVNISRSAKEGVNMAPSPRFIYATYVRLTKLLPMEDVSVSFVQECGMIDFIRRKAKESNIDVSQYFDSSECMDDIMSQYDRVLYRSVMREKYNDYLK